MDESMMLKGDGSRLSAAIAATIVAVGVVAAPPIHGVASGSLAPTVQLRRLAVELTTAAEKIDTAATLPSPTSATTSQADASGIDLNSLARAAVLIGLTPLWYATLPVTLPVTVAAVYFLQVAISCFGACGVGVDPAAALRDGVATWALGPLELIQVELRNVYRPPASEATASRTQRTAPVANPSQPRSHDRGDASGLAGSGRNPAATSTPSSHRTTKAPHTSEKKTKATAGSGRSTGKKP